MDNRLSSLLNGRRPTKIRVEDLDTLTRALIAVVRSRGSALIIRERGVEGILLKTRDDLPGCPGTTNIREIFILKSDWEKIAPFISDEFFETRLFPTDDNLFGFLFPKIARSEGLLDQADGQRGGQTSLYERVFGVLSSLFTESFPTSNL